MLTVQIEHPIRDYQAWKAAFDRDPAQRHASGVRRYRISRPLGDDLYVIIELDFDELWGLLRRWQHQAGLWWARVIRRR